MTTDAIVLVLVVCGFVAGGLLGAVIIISEEIRKIRRAIETIANRGWK